VRASQYIHCRRPPSASCSFLTFFCYFLVFHSRERYCVRVEREKQTKEKHVVSYENSDYVDDDVKTSIMSDNEVRCYEMLFI
jgi:hypothetical protein